VKYEILYGFEDTERLYSEVEDLIEDYVESSMGDATWPVTVYEFGPMEKPSAKLLAERVVEWLDEELGDPDGDGTEVTDPMLAGMQALLDAYTPWACEKNGNSTTITKEQAEEMLGEKL